MVKELNEAAVYVVGTTQAFQPPEQAALLHDSCTFGGKGADVELPNPQQEGQLLFHEPRIRIQVRWNWLRGKPELNITRIGKGTTFRDERNRDLQRITVRNVQGAIFTVDPEGQMIKVRRGVPRRGSAPPPAADGATTTEGDRSRDG